MGARDPEGFHISAASGAKDPSDALTPHEVPVRSSWTLFRTDTGVGAGEGQDRKMAPVLLKEGDSPQ